MGLMAMDSRPRWSVAFADIVNPSWTAGAHYYQNLFAALCSLDAELRPRLGLVRSRWSSYPKGYDGYRATVDEELMAPDEPGPSSSFVSRQRLRLRRIAHLNHPPTTARPRLASLLRARSYDVIFTCWEEYGPAFGLPLLGWIPDFQHLHLPDLFSPEETRQRDKLFARMSRHATRIVLSSEDAQRDFASFAPGDASKARVLPFVAQVPKRVYDVDPAAICGRYHLPKRFFYLPNQFWRHKNHELVIDALRIAKKTHDDIAVVCTGNTQDNRDSLYVGQVLAQISKLDLRDNMIILGWVPHADTFALMRQSLALLQPSLFEGWSTTVEESRSLGKHVILSDISIHREQDPPSATFIDPSDPRSLAGHLLRVYEEREPGADEQLEAAARRSLLERTRRFGERFMRIVAEVAG
jgi:glycosyltransferase involved in cell wall biosynthesis